ncbi:MAG TPA: hypothetical protein VE224_01425 [Pseudolabrys sp.]|nr:hypothetical protein [Pseudolabrys sp.]
MFEARTLPHPDEYRLVQALCNFVAAQICAKQNRAAFGAIWHGNGRLILPEALACTGFRFVLQIFAFWDQPVVGGIPLAHVDFCKFNLRGLQPASASSRCVLVFGHVKRGSTCLGPDLEAECGLRLRSIRIRRRDFAGGILSSGVRDKPSTKPVRAGRGLRTPESRTTLRCFDSRSGARQ